MSKISSCTNCGGKQLFRSEEMSAGGGYAPNWLHGLGSFWSSEKLTVVVCKDCGSMRFFAREQALVKLPGSSKWSKV